MEPDPIDTYCSALVAQNRASTAKTVGFVLRPYAAFLATRNVTPATATVADMDASRAHLAGPVASAFAGPLARSTQIAHLSNIRTFHRWLLRRRLAIIDPTAGMPMPRTVRRVVTHIELDQQEAQAFLDTAAARVEAEPHGSRAWAVAWRSLALIALAMASGRRRAGLRDLRLADVDLERAELRVEREKGVAGRVLPIARWAASITAGYIREARPILARGRDMAWLFPGERAERMGRNEARAIVDDLHTATCAANPDLANLPGKRITTHSLRVTCARLLFANGCPIRSVNAILLHQKLSTTAAYTPIPVAELRRVLLGAHPRA